MVNSILFIALFLPACSHCFVPFLISYGETSSVATKERTFLCWFMSHIFASLSRYKTYTSTSSIIRDFFIKWWYVLRPGTLCGSVFPTIFEYWPTPEFLALAGKSPQYRRKGGSQWWLCWRAPSVCENSKYFLQNQINGSNVAAVKEKTGDS